MTVSEGVSPSSKVRGGEAGSAPSKSATVYEYGNVGPDTFRNTKPMTADKCVRNVVGATQVENQSGSLSGRRCRSLTASSSDLPPSTGT